MKNRSSLVSCLILMCCFHTLSWSQNTYHYAVYNLNTKAFEARIVGEDKDVNEDKLRLKAINHFRVQGTTKEIEIQLKKLDALQKEREKTKITIIEYYKSDQITELSSTLDSFQSLTTLIINDCDNLSFENIVKNINRINQVYSNKGSDTFKTKFDKRPGIYYLNSLHLINQPLKALGSPSRKLRKFNYLEEIRIEKPKSKGKDAQDFIDDLINKWIVLDEKHYYYSYFPNLRFLGFTYCGLKTLPDKLKFRRELISVDLSHNEFESIPDCLTEHTFPESILSLNLSHNKLKTIPREFIENFAKKRSEFRNPKNKKQKKRADKFLKYLFLGHNELSCIELEQFAHDDFKDSFNTLTFECNPVYYKDLDYISGVLELSNKIDAHKIAKFMTGAPRSETDYNRAERLLKLCTGLERRNRNPALECN